MPTYAPNSNRPYTRMTPLSAIFVGLQFKYPQWGAFPAGRVRELSGSHPIRGYVFMACEREQKLFLTCIWDEFHADDDVAATCASFVKTGTIDKVMDWQEPAARERFLIAYNAVCTVRGTI